MFFVVFSKSLNLSSAKEHFPEGSHAQDIDYWRDRDVGTAGCRPFIK